MPVANRNVISVGVTTVGDRAERSRGAGPTPVPRESAAGGSAGGVVQRCDTRGRRSSRGVKYLPRFPLVPRIRAEVLRPHRPLPAPPPPLTFADAYASLPLGRRVKVGFITLGCDKNTVDSERYLATLAGYGAEHTAELDEA